MDPLVNNSSRLKDTLDFPDRMKNRTIDQDKVLISYIVSSLFTEVSLDKINNLTQGFFNSFKKMFVFFTIS